MKTCPRCHLTFKNRDYDSEEHLDHHTPFWNHGNIRVSGADQIRLALKSWAGSWNKYLKEQSKRDEHDYAKAIKLFKFEERNKIRFMVRKGNVVGFRSVENVK